MKKLMITAAAAAMVSGAFAINEAQVYDFTATIKTGACQETRVSKKLASYFNANRLFRSTEYLNWETGDQIGIRKQRSQKISGVIWGCDCITIADPAWVPVRNGSEFIRGYMFWNESVRTDDDHNGMLYTPWWIGSRRGTSFRWTLLNRIDSMTKCEGAFTLSCDWPTQGLFIQGAGFGTVSGTGCDTIVKSISGNIAGFTVPAGEAFGCIYCDANGCVVAPICDQCLEPFDSTGLSAASGTWKIKYNSSATRRLRTQARISEAYNFGRKSGYALEFARAAENLRRIFVRNGGTPDADDVYEEKVAEYEEQHDLGDDASSYLDGFLTYFEGVLADPDDPSYSKIKEAIRSMPQYIKDSSDLLEQEESFDDGDDYYTEIFDEAIARIVGDLS